MAASIFDSPLYARLFPTGDMGRLFSDSAALRAMLLVEGALAKAQGRAGLIPEISAAAIQRASLEIQIDPGALAQATGQDGVCVPGLVAAFRAEMNAPEHAQYVHWGATSQDIIDTALMLRLRQALLLMQADLRDIVQTLATAALTHAETQMPARTYGQWATPTTWGAVLAQWGAPLTDTLEALPSVQESSLWVSLSGASGTAQALGPEAAPLRAALAEGLGLFDPQRSWHTDRGPVLRITDWMAGVSASLGGMASTVLGLSASGIEEVRMSAAGGSSTMPQKKNPVQASALLALTHQVASLRSGLTLSAQHQHQRDGAAWFTEWMLVPQTVLSVAASLQHAKDLVAQLEPATDLMARVLHDGLGLMQAEALSFALCAFMPRPQAQTETKALCAQAQADNTPLAVLAKARFPDLPADALDPRATLGDAPDTARAFAARVRAL